MLKLIQLNLLDRQFQLLINGPYGRLSMALFVYITIVIKFYIIFVLPVNILSDLGFTTPFY